MAIGRQGVRMLSWLRAKVDREFNNLWQRREFVQSALRQVPSGSSLLDAGAGSQQFREFATHLTYTAQDFNQYVSDERASFAAGVSAYEYGLTDIVGNIWDIDRPDGSFDAVLCTEVLEHVPYPLETLRELTRVLRPGGILILTAPSNCLRHFDPYFYSSGYSDRYYEHHLSNLGFKIEELTAVGDYFSWMKVELFRSIVNRPLAGLALLPALLYFRFRRPNEESIASLCMGYHVIATKL